MSDGVWSRSHTAYGPLDDYPARARSQPAARLMRPIDLLPPELVPTHLFPRLYAPCCSLSQNPACPSCLRSSSQRDCLRTQRSSASLVYAHPHTYPGLEQGPCDMEGRARIFLATPGVSPLCFSIQLDGTRELYSPATSEI